MSALGMLASKAVVASLCAYEVAAICTGRVPTITAINRSRPEVGAAIVAALAWHFRPSTSGTVTTLTK